MAAQQEDVNAWVAANPNATPDQIYSAAQQYDVPGYMIDAAKGAWTGASDAWVSSQGLAPLTGGGSTASPSGNYGSSNVWGAAANTNKNPAVGTVVGSNDSGLNMNDAYYKMYQSQVGKSGTGESFDYWKSRNIGNEYQPSLTTVDKLGNAYYSQKYTTPEQEKAAWDNLISNSGLKAEEFNNLYGQYMDRAPVVPIPKPQNAAASQYPANFNSAVDANTETIEGRIKNLLDANNPVIRQAGDRAMAQFAGRGLLNSSMAIEAANEAMISKAIEIAGPDAQRYFQNRRENVDWTNKFAQNEQLQNYTQDNMRLQSDLGQKASDSAYSKSLQTNYLTSIQNAESQMQRFIQQVQASDIPPEAKTEQIQQMQNSFNNTISMMKAAYKNMPQWVDEWSLLPATIGG